MKYILYTLFTLILLSGCSSKNSFQPEKVAGEVDFDGSLKAKIIDVTREGATLANGQIITKDDGLLDIKIPENFRFVNQNDDRILIVSKNGSVKIITKTGDTVFEKTFEMIPASAAIRGKYLSIVFANNTLALYDMEKDSFLFKESLEPPLAIDARIANPYFLNDLLIFPTLDGRLLIMDISSKKVIRDVVVSSQKLFNNVLFLDVINNRLLASTGNRIISINPKNINILDTSVKDIIFLEDRVFVFTKNGKVILTNSDLKKLKEEKFPFAIFSGAIYGKYVYAVEKGGYLIALDKDLVSSNVYKLSDKINNYIFTAQDTLYYDDKYFKLNK